MQGSIDFARCLGQFPLSKILFCAFVMFRGADCELEREKPDHRSSAAALDDGQDLIGHHMMKYLLHTSRPRELNLVHNGRIL